MKIKSIVEFHEGRRRIRAEEKQESRKILRRVERRLSRLGYSGSALDHVSRLHVSENTLDLLLRFGYTTISELAESALVASKLFRVGDEWRSRVLKNTQQEALEALVEYYQIRLRLLKNTHNRMAKG